MLMTSHDYARTPIKTSSTPDNEYVRWNDYYQAWTVTTFYGNRSVMRTCKHDSGIEGCKHRNWKDLTGKTTA